jgi:hypothetical protein
VRTRTVPIATVALAIAGLVVALTALWPRSDEGSTDLVVEPGPPAASGVSSPTQDARPGAATSSVGRTDASVAAPRSKARVVRVRLGSVDIDSPVRAVGVSRNGQMALPADPEVLGWYRFGPAPGDGTGSVVLAGHLDSRRYGLGPLVGLRDVEPGETVQVTLGTGRRLGYTVVDVRRFDRQALPAELFARSGRERLRIITCGGQFLPDEGGYQQNLVVTAVPD